MKSKVALIALSVAAASLTGITPSFAGGSKSSTANRADGGKTGVTTSRRGTVITVYSKLGVPLCTRTSSITDHAKAIAKYKNMKC